MVEGIETTVFRCVFLFDVVSDAELNKRVHCEQATVGNGLEWLEQKAVRQCCCDAPSKEPLEL